MYYNDICEILQHRFWFRECLDNINSGIRDFRSKYLPVPLCLPKIEFELALVEPDPHEVCT